MSENEQLLSLATDLTPLELPVGVYVVAPDGHFVKCNRRAREILHLPLEGDLSEDSITRFLPRSGGARENARRVAGGGSARPSLGKAPFLGSGRAGNLAVIVSVVLTSASGRAQNDEASVRDVLLRSASSFAKNDIAEAVKVWANDDSLTIFESGHANYGWADYRDHHLVPEMGEMKNTKYELSDIKIHLAGKTAWATLKYTIAADAMDNGMTRHVDGGGLGTAILEKRTDGWRIVHWHSSRAPTRAHSVANTEESVKGSIWKNFS